MNLLSKG